MLPEVYEQFLDKKVAFLEGFVDEGTDQELFAASYIHGHVDIVAAEVFAEANVSASSSNAADLFKIFEAQLSQSIDSAISQKELSDEDAQDVIAMLARFRQI